VRQVVLASGSPRRKELLSRFIPDLVIDAAGIDEDGLLSGTDPVEATIATASAKALAVAARHPGAIVVGCDTAVVLGSRVLGKPRDETEAARMILDLAGRCHEVVTGIALAESSDPLRSFKPMLCEREFASGSSTKPPRRRMWHGARALTRPEPMAYKGTVRCLWTAFTAVTTT